MSSLQVRDAPALPGLTFRRFRGPADYPAMVAILDACNIADHLDYINRVEEIASVFARLTNCDPARDMLFAQMNGETIAFSRAWWADEDATRLYISLGFVHPARRREGLGVAMLRYDENRLREIARAHTAPEKIFRAWATDQEHGALALFA